MKSKLLIAALAVLSLTQLSMGQGSGTVTKYGLPKGKEFDRFSIGLYGGMCLFQGDVREKNTAQNSTENFTTQPCYGLQFNYQATHSIGILLKAGMAKFEQSPDDSIFIESKNKSMLLK